MVFLVTGLLHISLAASTMMAGISSYTERLFDFPDEVRISMNAVTAEIPARPIVARYTISEATAA